MTPLASRLGGAPDALAVLWQTLVQATLISSGNGERDFGPTGDTTPNSAGCISVHIDRLQ